MISKTTSFSRHAGALLLVGTVLGGSAAPLLAAAQDSAAQQPPTPPAAAAPVSAPVQRTIRTITVRGSQRLEPETIRAYANLAPGQTYTAETLDQALKALYNTQLFADVTISGAETATWLSPSAKTRSSIVSSSRATSASRATRSRPRSSTPHVRSSLVRAARADVDRILELYRRQGRFAARIDPKIVQLDQNRVDVVFEIHEGDLAKIRAINILGNKAYPDDRLRKEMYSKQAGGMLGFLKSNDTYDPDRLAADQQKLRAFYLTEGYADFRVVQALAELTPDRRDFVITYVVDEGPRYHFGTVDADSALRDFPKQKVLEIAKIQPGSWFNAKQVEDAVTNLNEAAGNLGYAFADINPAYNRDSDKKLMNLTIKVGEDAARLRRADRHHRQHDDPRQSDPARVPAQ